DERVHPRLEQPKELLAGDALAARRLAEVPAELPFADPVHRPKLLLLEHAQVELRRPPAPAAVLAGRVRPLVRGAVRPAAHRGSDTPAHPMLRSKLLHSIRPFERGASSGRRPREAARHYSTPAGRSARGRLVVGAPGFEPGTSASRTLRATKL